jgi:DNA-binding NarL/FixJ family response regulator
MTIPAVPGPPHPIRVLVVDDQELVRSGFCVILDTAEGITVVGEAANGEAALAAVAAHHPDVVLMDIRMPVMDGLEATRLLTRGPAAALFVSEATVKTHVGNLLAKLGLRDRVQAVILAYETGIVVPGDPSARP